MEILTQLVGEVTSTHRGRVEAVRMVDRKTKTEYAARPKIDAFPKGYKEGDEFTFTIYKKPNGEKYSEFKKLDKRKLTNKERDEIEKMLDQATSS